VHEIEYILKRNKRLTGNINLRIKDGQVIVSAPFWISKKVIDNFVASKQDWISKVLEKHKPVLRVKSYEDGEIHLFFGEPKNLKVIKSDSVVRTSLVHEAESFYLTIYNGHSSLDHFLHADRAFLSFYLEQLVSYLTERVNFYCQQLGVDYSKLEVKKVSSIWGSCSAKNVLSFNRKLALAPKEVVDYVVIHEVCHLRERNHSSRFWGLVRTYDKNYKQNRRWLHQNPQLLDI
jgi:predicted metal-dependent hydrolase